MTGRALLMSGAGVGVPEITVELLVLEEGTLEIAVGELDDVFE